MVSSPSTPSGRRSAWPIVAVLVFGAEACHTENNLVRGDAPPRIDVARPAAAPPPVRAALRGRGWELDVLLDPSAPAATLKLDDRAFTVISPALTVERTGPSRLVARDGGPPPPIATASYRLRFSIDRCEHEPPLERPGWPGLCGYTPGTERPRRLAPYELLIDRESLRSGGVELHRFAAACVPQSGAGPSCELSGVTSLSHSAQAADAGLSP